MWKNKIIFILSFIISLFLYSCHTSKKAVDKHGNTVNTVESDIYNRIRKQSPSFNTIEGKAVFSADYDGKSINVKGTVKMQKDSCIIISFQPIIGIEMARIQATKNNIVVVDRVHSTYYKATYEDIKKMTGIVVDYDVLQSILSAQIFLSGINEKAINQNMFDASKSANGYHLKSSLPASKCPYAFDFDADTNYRLTQTVITERLHLNTFSCKYYNYMQTEKFQFPYEMELKAFDGRQFGKINISFSKIEIDKILNTSLSIPSKYKAGDISKLKNIF